MKRHGIHSVLAAVLALALILSLSACRRTTNARTSVSDRPDTSTTTITPEPPRLLGEMGPVYDPADTDSAGLTSPVFPDPAANPSETTAPGTDTSATENAEAVDTANDGTATALGTTEAADGTDPATASSDYQKGYMAGEAAGYAQGYKAGYDEGGGLGYDNGYKAGRTAGYAEIAGLVTSRIADATE